MTTDLTFFTNEPEATLLHHYLLVEIGWENGRRIYGTLLHIDIIDLARGILATSKLAIASDKTVKAVSFLLLRDLSNNCHNKG